MSIEDILLALDEQCREECQAIFNRAEREAQEIIRKAQVEADEIREVRLDKVKTEAESETASIIYSAHLRAKNSVIRAREEVTERALERAGQKLGDLRSRDDYPSILEGFIKEGISLVEGKVIVHVDARDRDTAAALLDRADVDYELIDDIETMGGVVISDGQEKIKIINTVEERLNRARDKLRMQVYEILFGEEEEAAAGGG